MKNLFGYMFAGLLVILGGVSIFLSLTRPIQIITDEGVQTIHTRATSVRRILEQAEMPLGLYDHVTPAIDEKLDERHAIRILRAKQVRVIDDSRGVDITFPSIEQQPANLLMEVGIQLFPEDQVLWNGLQVAPDMPLPDQSSYLIQVIPAQEVIIHYEDRLVKTSSSAPTVGQALWDMGIRLHHADYTSVPFSSSLELAEPIEVLRAKDIEVRLGNQVQHLLTAAPTVGSALNQAGIYIQGLDEVHPVENQPIPDDNIVYVKRVSEEIVIKQTVLPYTSETVLDPEVVLDERRVVQAGHTGLRIERERIRYENGNEAARFTESEWVAIEPANEVIGYGTQIVLNTIDTPQGPKEYWRSMTAYATSYSPCRTGIDGCSYVTASGKAVQQGVIAVVCSLFSTYRGQQVYVPGYGVASVEDCGGGVPWAFWIDLAYSEEDYRAWHDYVTLYFLAPVPETIPYNIP